jgi:peptidyl-tRNA hydrolase, PTH1 family
MKLVIGLGNPGPQYVNNRHNVGFLAVDEIANTYNFQSFKIKKDCLLSEGEIGKERVALLKPISFMNHSGIAASEFIRFYKIPLYHIYTLHDDLDLSFGRVKVKQGGGHAGHNGLKSLDAHVGNFYWRIRIGVNHPGHKELVAHYLLSDFSIAEHDKLLLILDAIAQHLPTLLSNNADRFQSDIALQLNKALVL